MKQNSQKRSLFCFTPRPIFYSTKNDVLAL
jgi:hypothetical protein